MDNTPTDPWLRPAWAVVVSLLLCLTMILLRPCSVEATDEPDLVAAELAQRMRRVEDQALLMARAVAGEASLRATQDEVKAIGHVLRTRGMFYSAAIRTCAQHWPCTIELSSATPEHWPSNWSWSNNLPKFERIYELSVQVLAGEAPARCTPDHFGSAEDAHRAWRAGWRPIFCGRTSNWYWEVP